MTEPNESLFKHFLFQGTFKSCVPNRVGLINSTFILEYCCENSIIKKYISQKINTNVFKKPQELMENIYNVTNHIKDVSKKLGEEISRCTLNIIKTVSGELYYKDEDGDYWRAYDFIEDAVTYNSIESKELFYSAGIALGQFQKKLEDYPADNLYETIENFHNTPVRFENLCKSVNENRAGRKKFVMDEIKFFEDRRDFCSVITKEIEKGTIPVRVTHNDTKVNNVMIDSKTNKALCLIDLDTVMPGSALYDFGDSIRFGTNTAAEDEVDLSHVSFDLGLFEAYTKGYMAEMKQKLTKTEIRLLPESAILMTLECGMRFLTDYLDGDVYFGVSRENHNLDRARNQIKLVSEMEKNINKMREIVNSALI